MTTEKKSAAPKAAPPKKMGREESPSSQIESVCWRISAFFIFR
jgi:hypothetical protein